MPEKNLLIIGNASYLNTEARQNPEFYIQGHAGLGKKPLYSFYSGYAEIWIMWINITKQGSLYKLCYDEIIAENGHPIIYPLTFSFRIQVP